MNHDCAFRPYLSVVPDVVAKRNEARLELFGLETTRPVLVEVEERLPELVHLFVGDSLRVSRQNLGERKNFCELGDRGCVARKTRQSDTGFQVNSPGSPLR